MSMSCYSVYVEVEGCQCSNFQFYVDCLVFNVTRTLPPEEE